MKINRLLRIICSKFLFKSKLWLIRYVLDVKKLKIVYLLIFYSYKKDIKSAWENEFI